MFDEPLKIANELNFADVLALSIHDIKNSLSFMQESIMQLESIKTKLPTEQQTALNQLHYESNRVNTNLLQLLTVYKAQKAQLAVNFNVHFLADLFADLVASQQAYFQQKNLTVQVKVEETLNWAFDEQLIASLLNDILANASRYANSCISLSAWQERDYLYIQIADDGDGYPNSLLADIDNQKTFDLSTGRTGLGLYFARLIASVHNKEHRSAEIKLQNCKNGQGGLFLLKLP
ncbi:sensor histidine kinase [Gayadomonas joobiniege]|uniref:sensor histidine kinase n=1 Tax=Gayadomonas joobiniege TaxID=1234606 RepID=UPI00036E5870|nr:HAMP domain-containing sensor histidine kinase [Gayadomonas joobiniege]